MFHQFTKGIIFLLIVILQVDTIAQFENLKNGYPAWNNNPDVFEINREPARARLIPFSSSDKALKKSITSSEFFQLLNGKWKFNLVDNPSKIIKGFEQPSVRCE
ncbi:MAG: hypothetical protein H6613_13355 [Ignavibacteriales bacterium]|nr:hypothetical protein [Ignavibacteriales bacterium]